MNKFLYKVFRPFVKEHAYNNAEQVGYLSSLDVFNRCIAFRKLNGNLLFSW